MNIKRILACIFTVGFLLYLQILPVMADENLASKATAYLQGNNGQPLPPSNFVLYAKNAIDGDPATVACASNEWAWTLHLDLGSLHKGINSVALTFSDELNKPTDFSIMMSEDGNDWITVKTIHNNSRWERQEFSFIPMAARYVRIRDLKAYPDISQMHISEVEIYAQTAAKLDARLVSPSEEDGIMEADTPIVIGFTQVIPQEYMSKITLTGDNGEIDCEKTIDDKGKVTIKPKTGLPKGKQYTLSIEKLKSWKLSVVGDNLTRTAKAYYLSMAENILEEATNMVNGSKYVNDGDLSTYADLGSISNDQCGIIELDFGTLYKNMSRVEMHLIQGYVPPEYKIMTSNDRREWKTVVQKYSHDEAVQIVDFSPTTARYLRVVPLERYFVPAEINVLSVPDGNAPAVEITTDGRANGDIVLQFSEEMDINTVNEKTVKVLKDEKDIACDFIPEEYGKRIFVRPKVGLEYSADYEITLSGSIADTSGNLLQSCSYRFTTEPNKDLSILTVSDNEYMKNREYAIYPAFVDNLKYQAWTEIGSSDYFQLRADGGKRPYTYDLASGRLPKGLSLSEDGKISGTPTVEETCIFTLRVTDSEGKTAEKELSMTANPYRAQWFEDARFGAMIQWGAWSVPKATTKQDIRKFENRIADGFNAEEWAQQLSDMGMNVLNFTFLGGDAIRMWPSKSPTVLELKLERNLAGELINACHKRNIKVISYIATDYCWIPGFQDRDLETGSASNLTVNMCRELIDLGIDGFFFDAGWTGGINNFDRLITSIRSYAPFVIMENNPSISGGGWIPEYPDMDLQEFECTELIHTDEALRVGFNSGVRKKMAVDVNALLGPRWGDRGEDGVFTNLKSVKAVIKNIQDNWDRNATYMLCWPVMSDGTLIEPTNIAPSLKAITDWVKSNITPTQKPDASLEDQTEYNGPQTLILTSEPGAAIYYTTDGSIPDTSSTRYAEPILLNESVKIKACAYTDGKGKSRIMEKDYIIINTGSDSELKSLISEEANSIYSQFKLNKSEMSVSTVSTRSSNERISPEALCDGKVDENYWTPEVGMGGVGAWIKIDLSSEFMLDRVVLNNRDFADIMSGCTVALSISDDGINWFEQIASAALTSEEGINTIQLPRNTKARYIKLTKIKDSVKANDEFAFQELDFYGAELVRSVKNIMVGMAVSVGKNPIVIDSVGRYATGNDGGLHHITICKQEINNPPLLSTDIDMSEGAADENGFKYKKVTPVILEPFQSYYIICDESSDASYLDLNVTQIESEALSDIDGVCSDDSWTRFYKTSYVGAQQQLLNLKFKILPSDFDDKNIALGARTRLLSNDGTGRAPSGFTKFAANSVDADINTCAAASEAWAWTLWVDLKKEYSGINQIRILCSKDAYPTEYEIYASTDNENWTCITYVPDTHTSILEHNYSPFSARYLQIRSLKPDGPNQEGYQMWIYELEVYRDENAQYTSNMPPKFDDLASSAWAEPFVYGLASKGIMEGTDVDKFSPDKATTRGELIKTMVTAFNIIDENAVCDFKDIKKGEWYYPYIATAAALGLVSGTEEGLFEPERYCTREDVAKIAYSFAKYTKKRMTLEVARPLFLDISDLPEFSQEAIWYVASGGVMTGDGNNYFSPQAYCTRAMAAKIIYSLIK